jgi:hypothetical protein
MKDKQVSSRWSVRSPWEEMCKHRHCRNGQQSTQNWNGQQGTYTQSIQNWGFKDQNSDAFSPVLLPAHSRTPSTKWVCFCFACVCIPSSSHSEMDLSSHAVKLFSLTALARGCEECLISPTRGSMLSFSWIEHRNPMLAFQRKVYDVLISFP